MHTSALFCFILLFLTITPAFAKDDICKIVSKSGLKGLVHFVFDEAEFVEIEVNVGVSVDPILFATVNAEIIALHVTVIPNC
ncbi:hypothetical protein PRIPAC_82080 [Pristionchus pacificus]|uniref:Uncharacterized protein n=1 Tax=Pristionchus pacificus TaxID=54126 RepID=A0A2A6CQI7_PRIPA|nr:hypothetical protein PRIPAC_82080 [Pristionchus pacificus]|eukprot:PDM80380.1 hypothetical protein PRIPAC_32959 [Pristionchus pacificus]